MAANTTGRRAIIAAIVMIIAGQLLAIANDLYLRQSDPSDIVGLVFLGVLSVFLLRRASWARWITIAFVSLGGVLELAGVVLLIATKISPDFWSAAKTSIPALVALRAPVLAFTSARAFPLLAGSVLVSAVLDLAASATLLFAPSVRSHFRTDV